MFQFSKSKLTYFQRSSGRFVTSEHLFPLGRSITFIPEIPHKFRSERCHTSFCTSLNSFQTVTITTHLAVYLVGWLIQAVGCDGANDKYYRFVNPDDFATNQRERQDVGEQALGVTSQKKPATNSAAF